MAQIDWSLLQTPDYFGNALKAQALGQQQRQQDAKQNALKQYSTNPQGAIDQLATVDPETAANLQKLSAAKAQATARSTVAQKLQSGDVEGARSAALSAGDTDLLNAVDKMDDQQRQQAGVTAFLLKKAPAVQQDALKAKLVASVSDPTLKATLAQATLGPGVLDQIIGQGLGLKGVIEQAQKDSTPLQPDPQKPIYMPDPVLGSAPASAATSSAPADQVAPTGQGAAPTQTAANPDAVWAAIKQQESGGDGNAVGPQTPYGQAQGSTQMLMSTAEGQARKLGVSWRPDLMRGDTPNALAYQDKLGRAYFQEGMDKYGGDVSKATAYYFGGPNERLWGPKTQQYVQDVSARVGGGTPPPPPPPNDAGPDVQPAGSYQVAANGSTPAPPAIPGYRLVSQGRPPWQSDGQGTLVNTATGDRKVDPTYNDGTDAGLTDDAVQLLAGRYLKDGTLPPLGMGKTAASARQRILNQATKMAKDLDLTAGDLVAGTVDTKAAASALTKQTQQLAAIQSFEETARKNADLMLGLAPKGGGQTNIPVVNRWLQAGRKQIAGDTDVTSFDIALGTFADEYAKIVSGSTGGQGSTDASRKEAYDRLSKYATQGQLQAGIATMKQEMGNRVTSMEDVNAGLRAHIRGGGSGAAPADQPAPAPAAAAPPRSAGWTRSLPPAQLQTAMKFKGATGQAGTPENPFVPSSQAEYDNLPPGAHYVHTSGAVKVKP